MPPPFDDDEPPDAAAVSPEATAEGLVGAMDPIELARVDVAGLGRLVPAWRKPLGAEAIVLEGDGWSFEIPSLTLDVLGFV